MAGAEFQVVALKPEAVDEVRELLSNPLQNNNFFKALNFLRLKALENPLKFLVQNDNFSPLDFAPLPFLALEDYLREIDFHCDEDGNGIFSIAPTHPYQIPIKFDGSNIVASTWVFKSFIRINLSQYAWILDSNRDVPVELRRMFGEAFHLHEQEAIALAKVLRKPFQDLEERLARLCLQPDDGILISPELAVKEFKRLLPNEEELKHLIPIEKIKQVESDFLKPDFFKKYYNLCNHRIDLSYFNQTIRNDAFPKANMSSSFDVMLSAITADFNVNNEWEWSNVKVFANNELWQTLIA